MSLLAAERIIQKVNKNEINNIEPILKKDRASSSFCGEPKNSNPVANVLVIDNDKESTRFILEILARKGIRGTVAGNKKTVVDFLDRNNYDLVFNVNQINQSEDDFKLVRELKVYSPEMPVIMIYDAEKQQYQNQQQLLDIAVKAINAGYSDFLVKPLDRKKIENLLDSLLPGAMDKFIKRYEGNPTLLPKPENSWENYAVFNPGAFKDGKTINIVYRSMSKDNTSYLGLATTTDGI